MRRNPPERAELLMRLGAAKSKAGRTYGIMPIQVPAQDQSRERRFSSACKKNKLQEAQLRDGHYLLRAHHNLIAG